MKINVSVIIIHNNKLLVIQRALDDDYFPGAWGIPGGYMEAQDTSLEDTAKRETYEEVGIRIVPKSVTYKNRNDTNNTMYYVMLADLESEASFPDGITTSDEVNDYRWIDMSEIDSLD